MNKIIQLKIMLHIVENGSIDLEVNNLIQLRLVEKGLCIISKDGKKLALSASGTALLNTFLEMI